MLRLNLFCVYYEACETTEEADVIFLLDTSGRIGSYGFGKVKDFAKGFTSKFHIGNNNVRVGVIVFSTRYLHFYPKLLIFTLSEVNIIRISTYMIKIPCKLIRKLKRLNSIVLDL